MRTKIKPHGQRLLIKPTAEIDRIGLIWLPQNAKERPLEGTVITLGTGKRDSKTGNLKPFEVTAGQKVVYGKYAGTELQIDGETFSLIHADDIIGVIE
jgi:chaperonin GroES